MKGSAGGGGSGKAGVGEVGKLLIFKLHVV